MFSEYGGIHFHHGVGQVVAEQIEGGLSTEAIAALSAIGAANAQKCPPIVRRNRRRRDWDCVMSACGYKRTFQRLPFYDRFPP